MPEDLPYTSTWRPAADTTGFPSPAYLWRERVLSLDDLLFFPEASYFVRMRGRSMQGLGIFDQDLLLVDRAVPAESGSIIIAQLETGFFVKRLLIQEGHIVLHSAHPSFPPLAIRDEQDFRVWGVVLYSVRATHPWSKKRLSKERYSKRKGTSDQER